MKNFRYSTSSLFREEIFQLKPPLDRQLSFSSSTALQPTQPAGSADHVTENLPTADSAPVLPPHTDGCSFGGGRNGCDMLAVRPAGATGRPPGFWPPDWRLPAGGGDWRLHAAGVVGAGRERPGSQEPLLNSSIGSLLSGSHQESIL